MGLEFNEGGVIRRLALNLRMAPKRIQAEVARELRDKFKKIIDDEFSTKTDPYGKAWKPPKAGGETMVKTGQLRRGFTIRVVPGGVGLSLEISNKAAYAAWLQKGTSRMVPRRMVPDTTMPESWKRILDDAYKAALDRWYASLEK